MSYWPITFLRHNSVLKFSTQHVAAERLSRRDEFESEIQFYDPLWNYVLQSITSFVFLSCWMRRHGGENASGWRGGIVRKGRKGSEVVPFLFLINDLQIFRQITFDGWASRVLFAIFDGISFVWCVASAARAEVYFHVCSLETSWKDLPNILVMYFDMKTLRITLTYPLTIWTPIVNARSFNKVFWTISKANTYFVSVSLRLK